MESSPSSSLQEKQRNETKRESCIGRGGHALPRHASLLRDKILVSFSRVDGVAGVIVIIDKVWVIPVPSDAGRQCLALMAAFERALGAPLDLPAAVCLSISLSTAIFIYNYLYLYLSLSISISLYIYICI